MKIARNTLAELVKIVTGDTKMSPYRSGPMLVRLFNEFGSNDFYGPGFPSRWKYTEERLLPLNGKPELQQLVDTVFDAREWIGKDFKIEIAVTHLNRFLKFDGYELAQDSEHFKVREIAKAASPSESKTLRSHHRSSVVKLLPDCETDFLKQAICLRSNVVMPWKNSCTTSLPLTASIRDHRFASWVSRLMGAWDEVIGHMFFAEYQRWSTGSMKHLYEKDKQEFKIEFGRHIESIRNEKPMDYILGLLRNLVSGRKQLPCLVFDNADHFSIDFQEKVFQFARSLFEQELCVVIMPIAYHDWHDMSRAVIANFLRYLIAEDQIYCRIPDHKSYLGQVAVMQKMEASARYFEQTFR